MSVHRYSLFLPVTVRATESTVFPSFLIYTFKFTLSPGLRPLTPTKPVTEAVSNPLMGSNLAGRYSVMLRRYMYISYKLI